MTKKHPFPYDPNYVTAVSPAVKGKITTVIEAAMEYAFIGAKDPEDHECIEDDLHAARYDLEQTICTLTNPKKWTIWYWSESGTLAVTSKVFDARSVDEAVGKFARYCAKEYPRFRITYEVYPVCVTAGKIG